jgi:hypothetical protein
MYYSAEQERHDDAFYGLDDNHERYAATIESHHDECPPWPGAGGTIRLLYPPPAWDTMDIPF